MRPVCSIQGLVWREPMSLAAVLKYALTRAYP